MTSTFVAQARRLASALKTSRLWAGLIGASVLVGMAAPASAAGVWDRVLDSGKMHCAGLEHPPISWKVSDAEYQGYLPEICRALVKDLSAAMGKDLELVFVPTNWSNIILDVQSGRIDIAGALGATEDRKKAVDMPGPAYILAEGVIYRKGFEPLKTWDEYNNAGISVAIIAGTTGEKAVHEKLPNAQHMSFPDRASMILALQSGRADISVDSFNSALAALKEAGSALGGFSAPEPRVENPSNFAVQRDGDGRMAAWLQEWSDKARADGMIRRLIIQSIQDAGMPIDDLSGIGE